MAAILGSVAPEVVSQDVAPEMKRSIRFATYNVSMYGKKAGQLRTRLQSQMDRQATMIAEVIQTVRPDVLLLNEIDYDSEPSSLDLFVDSYLATDRSGRPEIAYPYRYSIPSNTGIGTELDLDQDGLRSGPGDAWGWGVYPGQYAMAIISRYPLEVASARTFQNYRWSMLPGALRPVEPHFGEPFHPDEVWREMRLSSKNHVDVVVDIDGTPVHLLVSHPTPPVFDGDEDRNGRRNHDEIRFWLDYLGDGSIEHLVDDSGRKGGLAENANFVVLGDLNSDPLEGDSRRDAITKLLEHPRLIDPHPKHSVAVGEVPASGPAPADSEKTGNFGRPGGYRVDYVLPSREMKVVGSGVYWPHPDDPKMKPVFATDHRLVWVDVELP